MKKINGEYIDPDTYASMDVAPIEEGEGGDCVLILNGTLSAAYCDEPNYFICAVVLQ